MPKSRSRVDAQTTCAYPPASEAIKELADLTERKNPHTPVYGVKESVCLSVTNFELNYLWTGRIEWSEFFLNIYAKNPCIKKKSSATAQAGVAAEDQNSNILYQKFFPME